MMMPGRKYSEINTNYRYGFNGKENDNDIENGAQDYGMRIYDTRLGRFLSTDPLFKDYPFYTPYQFAGNTPIRAFDLDGLEITFSDVWHNRASIVDWINEPSTWTRGAQNVNEAINPLYLANKLGYQIRTGKDYNTGEFIGRSKATADAGVNVMMYLSGEKALGVFRYENAVEKEMVKNSAAMGQAEKSAIQSEAQQATNIEIKTTTSKAIRVVDRTPQRGGDFGSQCYTLSNGRIDLNSRAVTNGTFDFVVTNDGKLVIGSGHYNLSNEAESVRAAGQISIFKGKVTNINNSSGHYKPSIEQAESYGNILKDAGVDISKSNLNLYDKAGKKVETIKL